MKKMKRLFSFVLICAIVFGALSVYAKDTKNPPSVEEEFRMAEEIRKILREVGVGTAEGCDKISKPEFITKSNYLYAGVGGECRCN